MWVFAVLLVGAVAAGAGAVQLTDEEYHSMPKLFHQDHYERCLARPQGLYCMGSFRLSPAVTPHQLYDLMKAYSTDRNHFDRTLLHRGYCVSSRCPRAAHNLTSDAQNVQRFEACVSRWARNLRLRARLHRLTYCRTARSARQEAREAAREDSPHQLWLQAATALLAVNVVGTVYDVVLGDELKKNKFLMMWSLRSNWQRLTASHVGSDAGLDALAPIQGYRVILLAIVIFAHAGTIHHMLYLHNPEFLEAVSSVVASDVAGPGGGLLTVECSKLNLQMSAHPLIVVVQNGASITQVFVMLSSFLLAYNLLRLSHQHQRPLTYMVVPKVILYRVFRIAPLSLLVVTFMATWWPLVADGGAWQALAAREAAVCRRKLWSVALFASNVVQPDRHCLLPAWFLAVDMQLQVVCALLMVALHALPAARRERALLWLFAAACAGNAVAAQLFNWKSLLFIMKPEAIRTVFAGVASFSSLYTSAWGSLPAALLGLLAAHQHHRREVSGAKTEVPAWIRRWYWLGALLPLGWIFVHGAARGWRRGAALLSAAERPGFVLAAALPLRACFYRVPGSWHGFLSWHGWRVLARLSLAALLLHWPVDMLLAAAAPYTAASMLHIFADGLSTWGFTYLLAVPLTLMVEMPFTRMGNALL